MSTKRTDKVWLCAGCKHGFMITNRSPGSAFVFAWAAPAPDDGTTERDYSSCYCANQTVIDAHTNGGEDAPKRVRIDMRVIACQGFALREQAAEEAR